MTSLTAWVKAIAPAKPKESAPIEATTEAAKENMQAHKQNGTATQSDACAPRADISEAKRLFNLGYKLCKLSSNSKRPLGELWNRNPIKSFDESATGYGVMLSMNALCSIDPDNAELSETLLSAFGFNQNELLDAGVRSASTRPGSGGRSAFRADQALRWVKFSFEGVGTVLELRAHSPNLQDVVPGLVYNDKDGTLRTQRYVSNKRLDDAVDLPEGFLTWWRRMSTDLEFMREQQRIAGEALGIKPQLSISGGEDGKLAFPWTRRTEFNEITLVEDILVRHNYAGADGRYAPPTATGLPGIREIPARDGLWQSDHASDPLFGTFDAWTAYVVLDHDGDFDAAVLAAQGILTKYISELFEVINTEPNTPETLPAFGRDKQGQIFATKQNVMLALKRADICGVDLRHDEFRDEVMLAQPGTEDWRAFRDTDYTRICLTLEHGSNGFKDISKEKIRDSVAYVAEGNRFDSAQHWLGQQVWDGVPRVERSIINYFSAEDSLYTRAVGLYLWTALAGRVLHPGIKADMVPVAVGIQGSRKSSTVASISPAADFFLELDLGGKDDDLARLMRGKLIIELGELKGLRAREVEHLKSFITRTHESWVPKFKEMSVHYARRCVFFGTTNKSEFLADDTGHRRWLPFETGQCNPSAMERDRGQLWAEGRELFKKKGVAWEAAEQLAGAEHEKFVVHDAWEDRVAEWLTTPDDFEGVCPGDKPLTASGALLGAIGLGTQHSNKSHLDRMASVLKALGYGPDRAYIGGKRARAWVKNA